MHHLKISKSGQPVDTILLLGTCKKANIPVKSIGTPPDNSGYDLWSDRELTEDEITLITGWLDNPLQMLNE